MRYLLLPGLFFGLIFSPLPPAFAGDTQWPVEIYDVMDNQKLVVFLANDDIAASPPWQPAQGGPPVSIAAALEYASQWIEQDPRMKGARIHEIELKPIHEHENENRWYYLLQLRTGESGKRSAYYIAVLFNGKVVPAIVEPASYK